MIHRFMFEGHRFLVDANSGTVHVIDQLVWDILEHYPETATDEIEILLSPSYSSEDIVSAVNELKELESQGLLFSQLPDGIRYASEPVLKALCLHVAHDCNLACGYCFAGQGDFGHDRSLMDLATGKAAIDFLLAHSGMRRHVEIDFFGGEPTLNMSVVKELVSYTKEKGMANNKIIKLTLTTNGTLLDSDTIAYLNEEKIALVLSIDGRKEVNDNMRPYCDGSGSYNDVMGNLKAAVQSRDNDNYYVRGTYTKQNKDFAQDVLHMVEQGFKHVSVEPVVAHPKEPYAIGNDDLDELRAQYTDLAKAYIEAWRRSEPFNFFHFNVDLDQGPCLVKRLSGCGAGTEYVAITPEGDIYPCHQFVGQTEWLLGNVHNNNFDGKLGEQLGEAHLNSKEECVRCWAKVFCGGGCHANAYAANKDIAKPYFIGCELQRMRLEAAIAVQALCRN